MQRPDKVLRYRPLKEVGGALAKLQVVVLFHAKPIVENLDPKYCYCKKGERQKGKKSKRMVQCVDCWEWFHFDCVELAEDADVQDVEWKCGWCVQPPDKEGKHRWVVPGQKKGKLRHYKDVPMRNGGVLGGNPPQRYSAPQSWEGKAEEVQELARRVAVKKKKLTEAVEKLVEEGGHHFVDAEGMVGLESRPVTEAMIDEVMDVDVEVGDGD
jgi:hypothetical protein